MARITGNTAIPRPSDNLFSFNGHYTVSHGLSNNIYINGRTTRLENIEFRNYSDVFLQNRALKTPVGRKSLLILNDKNIIVEK